MSRLSRRKFVATSLAGAGASALPIFARDAGAAPMTRYNLASPQGKAMLDKYAKAVKIMMATPATSPLSWTFQWYTHAVPTNTTKSAALNTIFGPGSSPAKSLANSMWDTCQAHFSAAQEPYFLPWHRMYVCFFEMIIRKVLNDTTFTLPYWNYSVPAGYALPQPFRMQNDPLYGPLFRPNRRAPVNAGQPIYTGAGLASDLSPAGSLALSNYLAFNQSLDQNLHGTVHVFVGNNQGMGQIPWAANDPVFWMHHCNIDRLWVVWDANHSNPNTSAWLNKAFVFADTSGQSVRAIDKDYTNTLKCNYTYDQVDSALVAGGPAISRLAVAVPAAPLPPVSLATQASSGPIALGAQPTRVAMRPATPAATPSTSFLAERLNALPAQHRLYLVLNNLSATAVPETLYRVYLDLPEGAPNDPFNSNYVGSFQFFDAVPHGEDHAMHGSKPFTFDVTDVVANLQARGQLKPDHTVTIVPAGEPAADAKPVVGDISFVEQ
jgi:tyrosinase